MDNSLKNRNILIIVFELIVIALSVGGITFAVSKIINDRTQTLVTTDEYNIDYVGDNEIKISDLEPISDNLVDYNTRDNVIRLEFSLKGAKTNKNEDLIYDVMLNEINVSCSLLNEYTKWKLFKNGKLISNGSLDPKWDGNVLTDNLKLTNIQEDLPTYKDKYDDYVLIFWIGELCDDIETCKRINQSNILDSKISMKVFIALYSGSKQENKRIPNLSGLCINGPKLDEEMIPVTYKEGEWVTVDLLNNNWYDYSKGEWANSVVVKNKSKYDKPGITINNDDVMGYFVWIPRYRYKLWNVLDNAYDSYNAYDNGIDIIFEYGFDKTSDDNIENNKYLTHPAFKDNLKGFWVSKYEISKDNNGYRFIPSVDSYVDDTMDNYKNIVSNISNDYKLSEKIESHMINNLEWGAITYLSHSKYGVCKNNGCDAIKANNSYMSGANKQDTTTRNVFGVYDMAGGSGEYVSGYYTIGNATKEVTLTNGDTWYNGHGSDGGRDYLIRGGLNRGLFYFGGLDMSPIKNSTRMVLISK